MGADRLRVLVLALGTMVLLVASGLVMDWFTMPVPGGEVAIGLRTAQQCDARGACVSIPVRGSLAATTLWLSMLFAALVAIQAGARLLSGDASEAISRAGYVGGMVVIAAAGATGFFFQPELGVPGLSVMYERTWAPAMTMAGGLLGIVAIYYAASHDSDDPGAIYTPVIAEVRTGDASGPRQRAGTDPGSAPRPLPNQSSQPVPRPAPNQSSEPIPRPAASHGSQPIPTPAPKQSSEPIPRPAPSHGSQPIPRPAPRQTSQPIEAIPQPLRGKLAYATLTADLSGGGLDARREDGKQMLVLWRDLVGLVARRLPPDLGGATFIDVVSTSGSTLRILPWTRLTGDPVVGEDDERARSLILVVVAHAPHTRLDTATRTFIDAERPAAQLPDAATLAVHDERLA